MKKYLFLFFAFVLINAKVFSQLPDLPSASTTYDPQILPAGSYVIGMDNTTQANGVLFNLKAYGLVVHLLNSNIRVRWVIRPAKLKDEIDFSVVVAQRMITSATSTTTSISRNITISAGSTIGTLTTAVGVVVGMKISGQNAIPPNVHVVAISGNTITLSNEVTSALSNKSSLYDTLQYSSLVMSVLTDKAGYDNYYNKNNSDKIEVYDIQIGGMSFINLAEINNEEYDNRLSTIIFISVVYGACLIFYFYKRLKQ